MSSHRVKLCMLSLLVTIVPNVLALPGDRQQPIKIRADRMVVDERQGISHYSGEVHMTQGSLEVRADDLVVHINKGQVIQIIITGEPATLQQQRQADQPAIRSSAKKMEYDTRTGRLFLIDNASVLQGPNRFSGDRIEYDTFRSIVAAGTHEENQGGRVRAVIEPRPTSPEESSP